MGFFDLPDSAPETSEDTLPGDGGAGQNPVPRIDVKGVSCTEDVEETRPEDM